MRLAGSMKIFSSKSCQIIHCWKAFFKWIKKVYGTIWVKINRLEVIKEIRFPTSALPQCLACLTFLNFAKILDFDCIHHILGTQSKRFQNFKSSKFFFDFASMLSMLIKM